MQTRSYKGGEVSVWHDDDGKIVIAFDSEGARSDDHQMTAGFGPSIHLGLTMSEMADLIEWLDEMVVKEAVIHAA
jgi:hypothetical protein